MAEVTLPTSRRPSTLEELLGRDLMARLDRLDVISRKVFAGKMPGERRSKRRGQSVEFDDYRPYVTGDDLRHIDWNVLARLDRFFLKLFKEEEDLGVSILVDNSPSMDAGDPNKAIFAHRLAMALGYVAIVNQNRVSVATFGSGRGLKRLAPMRGRGNVKRLGAFLLESLHDGGQTERQAGDFHSAMRVLASARVGRGVLVLISDMMLREGYLPGLNFIAGGEAGGGGFDAYLVQVLSPTELEPGKGDRALVGDLRLIDAETGAGAEVTVSAALLKRYKQRLHAYLSGLERACRAREITHLLVPSDADVSDVVLGQLRRRGMLG